MENIEHKETELESLPIANFSPEKDEVVFEAEDGEHLLVSHDPATGKPIKVSQLKEIKH